MYRVMLKGADNKPVTGDQACMLGVRIPTDIAPDSASNVHPATGGMSVSPSIWTIPVHRVPIRLKNLITGARGKNEHSVWSMGQSAFVAGRITKELALRPENDRHGLVEPSVVMSIQKYQAALASTKNNLSEDESI